jgi:hypothetical protein
MYSSCICSIMEQISFYNLFVSSLAALHRTFYDSLVESFKDDEQHEQGAGAQSEPQMPSTPHHLEMSRERITQARQINLCGYNIHSAMQTALRSAKHRLSENAKQDTPTHVWTYTNSLSRPSSKCTR